jgi:hypothetical protein
MDFKKEDKLRFKRNGRLFIVESVTSAGVNAVSADKRSGITIQNLDEWEKLTEDEYVLLANGFSSFAELAEMVGAVDLTIPGNLSKFEEWKEKDGSRAGLQRILDGNRSTLEHFKGKGE